MARRTLLVATTIATLGVPRDARAVPADRKACFEAYEQVQVLMRRSKLRAAREAASECLADVCPSSLRADCGQWLKDIDARAASVVVVLTGEAGRVMRLLLDGAPWEARTDGTAIEIDPGAHEIVAERGSYAPVTVRVVVREGEKAQRVVIDVPPAPLPTLPRDPAPRDDRRPIPTSVWLFGGAGVLAAGGFAFFAATGLGKEHDLDACAPRCTDDQVGAARGRYLAADVFLGVSIVALGVATYLFLSRPTAVAER
jgi:hypothetical protein